jgi:hypothetical protein
MSTAVSCIGGYLQTVVSIDFYRKRLIYSHRFVRSVVNGKYRRRISRQLADIMMSLSSPSGGVIGTKRMNNIGSMMLTTNENERLFILIGYNAYVRRFFKLVNSNLISI